MWIAKVREDRRPAQESLSILSPAELQRFRAFASPRDAAAFLGRRVFLRVLLAGYLAGEPSDPSFAMRCAACGSSQHGKPYLTPSAGTHRLEFSASYSQGETLIGVGRGKPLGVDIERSDRDLPHDLLAYASSREEQQAVESRPPGARAAQFLLFWTLKEAYLKATGLGLSRHPAEISVHCRDGMPRFLHDGNTWGRDDWRLLTAETGTYRFALAFDGDCKVSWIRAKPPVGSPR